jgi:hypothetical protein
MFPYAAGAIAFVLIVIAMKRRHAFTYAVGFIGAVVVSDIVSFLQHRAGVLH